MKYYIDTEFHEFVILHSPKHSHNGNAEPKVIELISIGIVSETGARYYAVSKDFDIQSAWNNQWLRVNVLMPILYGFHKAYDTQTHLDNGWTDYGTWYLECKDLMTMQSAIMLINRYGLTREQIVKDIENICQPLSNTDNAEFYGYFSSYDWVVFCQLWESMLKLPEHFNQYPVDLRVMGQLVADREFSDIPLARTRFKKLKLEADDKIVRDDRHVATGDALWNKDFDDFITTFHR